MDKRKMKEMAILDAAKKLFQDKGIDGTKMDEIAAELGMSKGSIYFYFENKESLTLALTHEAIQLLMDSFYLALEKTKNLNRLEAIQKMSQDYMDFAIKENFYFNLIQEYATNLRHSAAIDGRDIIHEDEGGIYFRKLKDIHNLPLKIFAEEIRKGQEEGSISNTADPALLFLSIWSVVAGYARLYPTVQSEQNGTIYDITLHDWEEKTKKLLTFILTH